MKYVSIKWTSFTLCSHICYDLFLIFLPIIPVEAWSDSCVHLCTLNILSILYVVWYPYCLYHMNDYSIPKYSLFCSNLLIFYNFLVHNTLFWFFMINVVCQVSFWYFSINIVYNASMICLVSGFHDIFGLFFFSLVFMINLFILNLVCNASF